MQFPHIALLRVLYGWLFQYIYHSSLFVNEKIVSLVCYEETTELLVGHGKIMKKSVINLLISCLCLGLSSCNTQPEPLNVQIPAGLVAATNTQMELIANVKTLLRGMSLLDTKRHLGSPKEETSSSLFYYLIENRVEGGYYVTTTLTFDENGLADVKIGFGHESRSLRIEE